MTPETTVKRRYFVRYSAWLLVLQLAVLYLFISFFIGYEMRFIPFEGVLLLVFSPYIASLVFLVLSPRKSKGRGILWFVHLLLLLVLGCFTFYAYALGVAFTGG